LFAFLTAINLRPIEFSKARTATKKPTPYVGEILEAAFASAQAFVVILSPDDWAWLREDLQEENDPEYEKQATLQARPNVLFEAGMAMGWDPKRTLLIQLSDVRPFSDVGGLHILRMTDSPERRRELAERLSDAGCDVRLDGSMWLRAGNFDEAVPVEASVKDPMGKHSEDALVTARIDRDVGSSGRLRDLLVLENRGAGKAEDISVELDGQPLFSHPTVPSQNEIGVLGPFSRAHYLLAVTLGHPAPSTVSVKWVNPSGETGTFESSLSL
jgi:hypothetical protein